MSRVIKAAVCFILGLGVVCASGSAAAESVFTGSVDNSWSEPANWDPNGVPTAADDVSIPAGKSVVAQGDITCHDLSLAGSLTLGADLSHTQDPPTPRPNVSLTASGDIELSGAATLTVYAGQLADMSPLAGSDAVLQAALYAHANIVSAAGTMTFGSGTTVKPGNDYISGTPVIFRATDITVAAGATVNADGGGWSYFKSTETPVPAVRFTQGIRRTYAPGFGVGYSTGGAYGGAGGWTWSFVDRTYGFAFAPLMPGSQAGIQLGVDLTSIGGGTICLQASQTLTVKGSLLARGTRRGEWGGTSGGGIWLCGDTVDYASAELISADGESTGSGNTTAAGGGGRIAVCEGMTPEELLAMAGGTVQGEAPVAIDLPNVSVKGGVNTATGGALLAGGDGTAVYIVSASRFAHVLIKTPGVPELKMEGLSYEERILDLGETSVDVPAYAFLASDPNVRYSYDGYAVSNVTQEVCAGDASVRHIVFTLVSNEGPYTVYLKWTNREVRHAYGSVPAEYGSFTLNGENVGPSFADWGAEGAVVTSVIGFVPADGCTFVGWSGSYPRAHALGNPATCTSSVAYGLVPRVTGCTATGEQISWNGGEGRWEDAENWSGGKVPTLLDDVTIDSGSVTVLESFAARSLTLSGGTLTVGETESKLHAFGTVAGDMILSGAAVLKAKAARPLSIDKTSQQAHQSSLYDQADTIRIGGALQVGSGARIEIANDPLTGLPVIFRTGSLTVAEGGTLTADGGGFSWVKKTDESIFDGATTGTHNGGSTLYATFGYGYASSPSYRGGGYGGSAGSYTGAAGTGASYGFATAPLLPGSSSGLYPAKDKNPFGGGTVCVFAEGEVTVDGMVSSVGTNFGGQQGGSSGGAIWLAGSSVTVGDGATITVNGGAAPNGNAGAGGGGRVLLSVSIPSATIDALVDGATPESLELAKTEIPALQMSVRGGVNPAGATKDGKPGTNVQVYDGVSHVVTVVGGAYGSVAVNGSANVTGGLYWTPEGETDTLTAVPAAGCEFVCWRGDVPRDLCRTPTIVVSAATAVNVQAVFAPVSTEPTACHWKEGAKGDWYDVANWEEGRVPGSSDEAILASGQIAVDSALVAGSLIVSNGAALTVCDCREVVVARDLTLTSANSSLRIVSLPTDEANTWTNGATRVSVGGTFLIDDQATLYPESDEYTGGSPVFTCGAFFLAETAKVDASQLGFGGEVEDQRRVNLCPGGSGFAGSGAGGGYGGLGSTLANVEQYDAGHTYGLALSPIHPGAPNGVSENVISRSYRGGGLVRIHAGQMTVNGTVDASGQGWAYGGSSGGGIWLTCRKRDDFACGPSARLLVRGGNSHAHDAYKGFSCGGGGRIAVGVNLTEADCLAMIEAGAYPGRTKKHVFDRETFLSFYPGVTINVEPGYGDDPEKPWSDDPQYSGTFNFVDGQKFGLMLFVR